MPDTHHVRRRWLPVVLGALVVAAVLMAGRELATLLPAVTRSIASLGAAGPVLFMAAYALAAVALIPASLLTIAAGITFGLGRGVAYVLLGAGTGAIASFLIARYLARERVERWLAADPRMSRIDRAVEASGLKIMVLMRLSPVFPFGLQNYALGLTRVRLRDFAIALLGMVPGTVLYVYAGAVARVVASAAGGVAPPRSTGYYTVLGLGLCATLAVAVIVTRIARDALRSRDDLPPADGPGG